MISTSPLGPGFFIFFESYKVTELPQIVSGGDPLPIPDKVSYKIEDDEVAIALSLLLARRY